MIKGAWQPDDPWRVERLEDDGSARNPLNRKD
jgi:hypothetical protein